MNTIQVNPDSLPTFALGSMYAGQNAADAEAENQQNLGRLFLANQREQQMLPLDIESKELANRVAQYNAAEADAKRLSPTFLNNSLAGQEGQAIQNKVAGKEAEAISPGKILATNAENLEKQNIADLTNKFRKVDNALRDGGYTDETTGLFQKFTPQEQTKTKLVRDALFASMMKDPKNQQALDLQTLKNNGDVDVANIKANAEKYAADLHYKAAKLASEGKTDELKHMEDKVRGIVSGMIPATDAERLAAVAFLERLNADKISQNAALATPQIDLGAASGGKLPMTTPASTNAVKSAIEAQKRADAARGPSREHIQMLKEGKGTPEQFDEIYGTGAASKYLQGK